MRHLPIACFAAFTITFLACAEESEESKEVGAAFDKLVTSLKAQDALAVYGMSVKPFHTYFDELYVELRQADGDIRKHFPEWEQRRLRESLLLDRVGSAANGKSLFLMMTDMEKLRSGEEVDAGLEHGPASVIGDEATITTKAGEVFTFVREDGVWKTDLYLKAIQKMPMMETLRVNLATMNRNVKRLKELFRTSRDPKSPEGAFNQLVKALADKDHRVILALLDADTRPTLKKLAKHLDKGLKKDPNKETIFRAIGLDPKADVFSDSSLLRGLIKGGKVVPVLLPVQAGAVIEHVEVISSSQAAVYPVRGKPIEFVLEDDGLWHVEVDQAVLKKVLLDPSAVEQPPPKEGKGK